MQKYAILELGQLELPIADTIISYLVEKRQSDCVPDLLLFLSYRPCLAYGVRQLDETDLLKPRSYFERHGIPLYKTNRGGGLTYHWPGQLLCYPLLKLQPTEQNIPNYMYNLEQIGLAVLADFGVVAQRKRGVAAQIGLWIEENKIASMGIRIARWVTSYGIAINLDGDVSISHDIRPCGLDADLITIEDVTGFSADRHAVIKNIRLHFETIFRRRLEQSALKNGILDELKNRVS